MNNNPLLLPTIVLPQTAPLDLPVPKFQIGQRVYWKAVKDPDFGRIVGVVWATEGSVKAIGYHYAIQLDPTSPSIADGITSDWAFEADLALLPPSHPCAD
jgi:hypothetical protein